MQATIYPTNSVDAAKWRIDVVFFHGLRGDHKTTWQRDEGDEASFWPQWIVEDHPYCRVICIDYPADAALWFSEASDMPVSDRAQAIADYLLGYDLGCRPTIFIAHSLGGLIAKQILRTCDVSANPRWQRLSKSVWGVIFLGTPHSGATLASVAALIPALRPTQATQQLKWADDRLRDLGQWYSNQAPQRHWQTKAYAERKAVGSVGVLVDQVSADPKVLGCHLIPVDEDHFGICKPKDRAAPVYRGAQDFIKQCHEECERNASERGEEAELSKFLADEYEELTKKKEGDRLDLREKLEAGMRAHEIEDAIRKKERFAQIFMKHGLQSSAVKRYIGVLNDLESRFNRHVYPKILKGASQSEVNTSLQKDVIDPTLDAHGGGDEVINNSSLERMIYYLTGQCYIRWHHD